MAQRAASGSQGRLNRRFLMVALLLAGLSAALSYALLSRSDGGSSSGGGGGGDSQVVVARVPISERTLITEEMVEVVNTDTVVVGAFTTQDDVIGKVTKFPIAVNEQVIVSSVVDTSSGVSDGALALVVPTDKRAFSISASQVLTAGGLLLPGDYVDIVWVCCPNGLEWEGQGTGRLNTTAVVFSRPIVQNVQVAAVAQSIVPSGPVASEGTPAAGSEAGSGNPIAADTPAQVPDAATITLLVSPDQANVLMLAEGTGTMRAALRNPGDTAIVPVSNDTQFVSPGLIPPEIMAALQAAFTEQ